MEVQVRFQIPVLGGCCQAALICARCGRVSNLHMGSCMADCREITRCVQCTMKLQISIAELGQC